MMQLQFFPSRTIAWYMARSFLVRSFAVLAGLTIILQTLDLLGESGHILAHAGNGDAQLWYYVGLRVPQIIAKFVPFAVLLGTLITLATLNQNSEVISMKAAGISAHQILAPLVLASLFIAALSFAFTDRIVSRASATLAQWQAVDYGPVPHAKGTSTNIWVRDSDDIVHAAEVAGRGAATRLTDVTIYDRSGGLLKRIISAPRASFAPGGGWLLERASSFDIARGTVSPAPTVAMDRDVTPDQFSLSDIDADERSFLSLRSAIADLSAAGRPVGPLRAGLLHKISGPLSSALMPLLAGVAAFGLARSGRLFLRAITGMALGFAYFVADNFALAMGNLGAYPPALAAWAPFVLFLLIGELVLIRTEE